VRLPGHHLVEDAIGGIGRLHDVPVETEHAGRGKQCPDFLLDAFGADAEALDVATPAGWAAPGERLGAAAVVALQPVQCRVVDERDAAMRTLARLTAVAAEGKGRQPAAVQKQDRLLASRERLADRLPQGP